MAESTRIIITATTNGGTKKLTYKYADENTTSATIKTIAGLLVTNGDVFDPPITAIQGAILQTTTENSFDLS